MSYYREIHVDSSDDGRTRGNKSHPIFDLHDPLYLDKFCIRHVTIPTTFHNLYEESVIEWTYSLDGATVNGVFRTRFPAGNYSSAEIAILLENSWAVDGGNPSGILMTVGVGTDNTLVMTFSGGVIGDVVTWQFITSLPTSALDADRRACPILQKLLGYGVDPATQPGFFLQDILQPQKTLPAKFSFPNYILLRSNLCRGSSFLSNIRGAYVPAGDQGNYSSGNILAKIPLSPAIIPPNSVYTFSTNDSPSRENMFTFDGEYVDSFDLFFTYPNEDVEISFNNYNFSLTLGLLSHRTL